MNLNRRTYGHHCVVTRVYIQNLQGSGAYGSIYKKAALSSGGPSVFLKTVKISPIMSKAIAITGLIQSPVYFTRSDFSTIIPQNESPNNPH